jgi:hypothetical protein
LNSFANIWNWLVERDRVPRDGVILGHRVIDGVITKRRFALPPSRRAEHLVIIGKTGTGKTSLIKSMLQQDIEQESGFFCIDLHGDLTPFVLEKVALKERRTGQDLSSRTILINPANPFASVGLNILDASRSRPSAVVSEIVAILRQRWNLDYFGARTEELLRNCLWVLAENALPITALQPLLTSVSLRSVVLRKCQNPQVKAYFTGRYELLSEAMQSVMREPILNKITAFTTDPAIGHIVGQHNSTISLEGALDDGHWVILAAHKAQLGEDAETLAALILAKLKSGIFARRKRTVFAIYADELQALMASADAFRVLFAEARKFGVGVVTANQHLQQYPPNVRATLLSSGSIAFFRSSPEDAQHIATALDGGRLIERRVKELPNRQFLLRTSSDPVRELCSLPVKREGVSIGNLLRRINRRWTRPRDQIESQIQTQMDDTPRREALAEWK